MTNRLTIGRQIYKNLTTIFHFPITTRKARQASGMIRLLSTLGVSLALSVLTAVGARSEATELKLVVGGDHDCPPYEFLENGEPTGFNVELMRAVADVMGFEVEFRLGPWRKVRQELEQGGLDALAGMYYSADRSRLVDFSVPHTMVTSGIFVRKGSPIRSFADIQGKEIIVQEADIIHDALQRNGLASRIVTVTNPGQVLKLLASGKHDCAVMPSRLQGEHYIQTFGLSNIRIVKTALPQLQYCFAARKGDRDLVYQIDEGLKILKGNGRYREIYEKWFGVYEERDLWDAVQYYVLAIAIAAALCLIFLVWSHMLKRHVGERTAELRRSEEALRFTQYAIDNAADQAFWMTEDGRLFYVNDAACRALGYTRKELVGMSIPDIDPTHPPDLFAEHWRNLRKHGSITIESVHRTKDGRVFPVEIRANYVVFDGREYNCAFATDISERKRMEEELRNARDELEKRVHEWTAELRNANELLGREIAVRKRTENVNTARLRLLEFASTHNMDELLQATLDEAQALTGSLVGFYHFLETDLKTQGPQNWSPRAKAAFCRDEGKESHHDVSAADLWVDCIHERRPVVHNDYASLPHRKGLPPGHASLIRALVVPVFRGDKIAAVIGVGNKPQDYTSEDVEAVSMLADLAWEIAERKQAEEALRESESRVRRKLESILDPEGDTGVLELADILDMPQIQSLMEDLYRITGLKMGILDLQGRVLADVGWQDICLKFHRNHPETLKRCHESDTDLTVGVPLGEFRTYRCKNNMWHLVTPIIVGGRHMGNLFLGQFFFADEKVDYDLFRSQARTYGFPEEQYIAALEAVPRHSKELVNLGKAVFRRLTDMFSKLSYANIKLAHSLTELDRLTETVRKANLVVENSPAVLFRWKGDDAWPVELVSGNIKQFGYGPEDFLSGSLNYSSIIHPDDLERVTREVHDFCDGGADQFRLEYRIMTKGGDVRWVNEHTNVERDVAGDVTNFEGIVIDVTNRKLFEEELQRQKKLLQELNETLERRVGEEVAKNREKDIMLIQQNRQAAMGDLLDHIAHQWKQPLTVASLLVQNLWVLHARNELTADKIQESIDKTTDLLEYMAQTIEDFRDFYRPDKEKKVFSIKDSVDNALAFVSPALKYQAIAVELDVDPELFATGYPREYTQVLLNVLSNARDVLIERKTEKPKIMIKGMAEGSSAVVTITDNAGGISESIVHSIFDLYITTKEATGGTGIGLHMSKNIIEKNMGGSLTACNTVSGAKFRIAVNMPKSGSL